MKPDFTWQQIEVAKEADVIIDIAMILSPAAYKEGDWAWRQAKSRVRSKNLENAQSRKTFTTGQK